MKTCSKNAMGAMTGANHFNKIKGNIPKVDQQAEHFNRCSPCTEIRAETESEAHGPETVAPVSETSIPSSNKDNNLNLPLSKHCESSDNSLLKIVLQRMDTMETQIVAAMSKASKQELLAEIDQLTQSLDSTKSKISQLEAERANVQKKIKSNEQTTENKIRESCESQISKLKSDIGTLKAEKSSILAMNANMSAQAKDNFKSLHLAHSSMNTYQIELQKVKSIVDEKCECIRSKDIIIAQKDCEIISLRENLNLAHKEIQETHRQLQYQAEAGQSGFQQQLHNAKCNSPTLKPPAHTPTIQSGMRRHVGIKLFTKII
jgi:chemotaxis protein histidine kinase CheA